MLVVLALLIGTVLAGRAMLRQQEMRKAITEGRNYIVLVEQFRQKYGFLPGDFPYATEVWGTVGGGTAQCATPNTTASVGKTTCNGAGRGFFIDPTSGVNDHQRFRAWQHMAAAGLIPGSFTGITGGVRWARPGINVPAGVISGTGYTWDYVLDKLDETDPNFFMGDYGNLLYFGSERTNQFSNGPVFTPSEAQSVDTKYDDGSPAYGSLRTPRQGAGAIYSSNTNCTTGATAPAAAYNLSYSDATCATAFLMPPLPQ